MKAPNDTSRQELKAGWPAFRAVFESREKGRELQVDDERARSPNNPAQFY